MSSIFSLPLPTYQQPLNKYHGQRPSSKKRKRKEAVSQGTGSQDEPEDDIQVLPRQHQPVSSQSLEYSAVLTPEERTQYRAAGQPFNQDPPPFPFPHAPARSDRQQSAGTESRPRHPPAAPTLHLQHLSVITAILHRCLAERDYTRASRAFGLILRDSIGGHAIDIRNEGRWGIGAEILLKIGSQHDRSVGHSTVDSETSQQGSLFTREGFEKAKRYYEGLIIQYPFSKGHAASVNALDFYQALFGLWIYIVHEEGKAGSDTVPDIPPGDFQQRELQGAREIATRMDVCMSSIPFSDDLELIRLRGMVASWIGDLAEICSAQQSESTDGDAMSTDSSPVDDITADAGQIVLHDGGERSSRRALRLEAAQSRRVAHQMFSRLKGDLMHETSRD